MLADNVFREALAGILRKYFGTDAKRWLYYDGEGIVYGYPSMVEVNTIVKDNVHLLVGVKSGADPSDVLELLNIAKALTLIAEGKEGGAVKILKKWAEEP